MRDVGLPSGRSHVTRDKLAAAGANHKPFQDEPQATGRAASCCRANRKLSQ
jgi:hypothetical protein